MTEVYIGMLTPADDLRTEPSGFWETLMNPGKVEQRMRKLLIESGNDPIAKA